MNERIERMGSSTKEARFFSQIDGEIKTRQKILIRGSHVAGHADGQTQAPSGVQRDAPAGMRCVESQVEVVVGAAIRSWPSNAVSSTRSGRNVEALFKLQALLTVRGANGPCL